MTNRKGVTHSIKKEFRRERCGFDHNPPEDFFKSQWQRRSKSFAYLTYRWIIGLFFTAVVIYSMIDSDTSRGFWLYFIYLTNWGIIMCMITNCLGAALVSIWHFNPSYADRMLDMESLASPFKIYWCFHITTLVVSIVITTVYWSVLYNAALDGLSATNIMTHALNSILMFIDLLIVAHPMRLLHIFLPVSFGLVYTIFSIIYQKSGGVDVKGNPYIYFVLDWNQPDKAILVTFGILVLAAGVYMVLFLVYKLRLALSRHLSNDTFYPATTSPAIAAKSDMEICVKEVSLESGIQNAPSGISMALGSASGLQNQAFASSKESISK